MDNVFIIFKNFDDWDSQPYAIGFTDSGESAEAICSKLDSYHATAKEVGEKAREVVKPIYDEDLNLELAETWPKWPSGIAQKDITDEMRAEREAIQKANKEKGERNSAKFAEQRAKINSAVVEFVDSLDYDEDLMKVDKYGPNDKYSMHFTWVTLKLDLEAPKSFTGDEWIEIKTPQK